MNKRSLNKRNKEHAPQWKACLNLGEDHQSDHIPEQPTVNLKYSHKPILGSPLVPPDLPREPCKKRERKNFGKYLGPTSGPVVTTLERAEGAGRSPSAS